MKDLEIILSLAGTLVGMLITLLTFLAKSLKNRKNRKIIESTIKISNILQTYILEAEKFSGFSGQEKKAYVLTKANQFAIDKKLFFKPSIISEKIEELISLSNQVNVKKNHEGLESINNSTQSWI